MSVDNRFYDLRVRDIMDENPPLIPRDAPLREVCRRVGRNGLAWVVEVRGSKKAVGVITEKDVLDMMAPIPEKNQTVGTIKVKSLQHAEVSKAEEIMSKPLLSCEAHATVEEALRILSCHGVRRLAVLQQGEIVGQVRLKELVHGCSRYLA